MSEAPKEEADSTGPGGDAPALRVLNAQELFNGQKEVWITFAGVCYRLRVTRRGRLILTK